MTRGSFFSFEGIDGSGKSTQARLLASSLRRRGYRVVEVREPGTTPLGESVRRLLLTPGGVISPRAELCLFAAARAQLTYEVIRPALDEGSVVIADRFVDSSVAYQGAGRSAGSAEQIESISAFASQGVLPDRTYLIDVKVETARRRQTNTDTEPDRIEQADIDFHRRVRTAYIALHARHNRRILLLDGERHMEQLHKDIKSNVLDTLEGQ